MVIGTVAYLAPEQVSSASADARSDVYGAGVMLFELVTGRQPYTADTPLAVAYKHVNETVPAPSSLVPGLPPLSSLLVALATSRDPALRPGDASQLLHAVFDTRRYLPGGPAFAPGTEMPPPGSPSQPGRPGSRRNPASPARRASTWLVRHPTASARRTGPCRPHRRLRPAGPPLHRPRPHRLRPDRPRPDLAPPGPPLAAHQADGQAPQPSTIFGVPGVPGVAALPAFATGTRSGGTGAIDDAPQMSG